MTIASLEALRDAIRDSKGPDRELDAAFARLVCGMDVRRGLGGEWYLHVANRRLPHFFDSLAGPGALFAAALAGWPDVALRVEAWMSGAGPQALAMFEDRREERHPLLTHALALAMTEAAIQERDSK